MSVQYNQSVFRAFQVLEVLSALGRPVGSRELARKLGEEHTKVSRMLKSLLHMGYLQQDAQRQYVPGPGLHVLAARFLRSSTLLRLTLPLLRELHEEGFHVALGVLHGDEVCYLFHGAPDQAFDMGLSGHELLPARESSIGLLLSGESDAQVEAYFPRQGLGSMAIALEQQGHVLGGLALIGPEAEAHRFQTRLEQAREAFEGMEH